MATTQPQTKMEFHFVRISLFVLFSGIWAISLNAQPKPAKLTEQERIKFDAAYINAVKEKILSNNDDALKLLQYCYSVDPSNAAVHFTMAEVFFTKRDFNAAEFHSKKSVELDANNFWYKELYADILIAQKKNKEAAEVVLQIAKNKNDITTMMQASYLFALGGNTSMAIKVLDEVEKSNGLNEDVVLRKEQLYLMQNKFKKAVAEIKKLIAAYPTQTRYQGMLGELYMANGKTKEGLAIYQNILKVEPDNGLACFALADYEYSIKAYQNWFNYLKCGMKSTAVDGKAKVRVLSSFVGGTEFDNQLERSFELAEYYQQADPSDATAYLVIGDLYQQRKQFDSAHSCYRKAIAIMPENLIGWQQIIFSGSQLNSDSILYKDAKEALRWFPAEAPFYVYAAIAASGLQQFDEVISLCLSGLNYTTPADDALFNQFQYSLADAYHKLNKHLESDSVFEALLNRNPENALAMNNYAYFLSLRKVNLTRAETLSKKSLELDANNPSFLDTYGWILFTLKRYEEAKSFIEKSLALEPDNAEVLEHLGDVHYHLNDKTNALIWWNKALEKNPTNTKLQQKITQQKWYE